MTEVTENRDSGSLRLSTRPAEDDDPVRGAVASAERSENHRATALHRDLCFCLTSERSVNICLPRFTSLKSGSSEISVPATTNLTEILGTDHEKYRCTRDLFAPAAEETALARETTRIGNTSILKLTGEFWTSGQRQASSLHEVSYRACFKPQLPHYFIKRFTRDGDSVYDPFSGRGTTAIEAGLMGRKVIANDANPLSRILTEPRLAPPTAVAVEERLQEIKYHDGAHADIDLSMFYHPETESEIVALRRYLNARKAAGEEDIVDSWIRMVATNRLTGHSPGFFSVYTFPPNQAVSAESQKKINERRRQKPGYRDTKQIISKKTVSLLARLPVQQKQNLEKIASSALLLTSDARCTREIATGSVHLTVTSPPFLDIVEYAGDNWLRCWFNGIDVDTVARTITMARNIEEWSSVMGAVFEELYRITKSGGWVAFEVGEVRNATVKLEEFVIPLGLKAGFSCEALLINEQAFTKTANIWGVTNNKAGTNTNRIALFRR